MSVDTLKWCVPSSTEPQEQHSSSMSSKGSQRCISIRADVDDASSGLPELDQAQAHAVAVNQDSNMPASKDSCGVVYDAVMELHMREGHPEHPNRIKELSSRLEREGLLGKCTRLTPKLATDEELLKCHSRAHIDRVDGLYSNPVTTEGKPAEQVGDTFIISGDIYCNRHTSMAARSAAGCCVQAVRAVLSGQVSTAFAIVRPPGHHAESQELMGFCFFNNVAVAAHAALEQPGVERVLILDWDIHHGNGTQQIFQEDPRVLFVSLHRRDGNFYPQGCGYAEEVGKGPGGGFNVNVPWTAKGMGDADYLAAFDLLLKPIIAQFDPQLVLISAGFDAADGDFLGRCRVSPAGFAAMTARLQRHAGGKVVAVLEGGYVPSLVGECAAAVMAVLQGTEPAPLPKPASLELHKNTRGVLAKVDKIQSKHWTALAALPKFEQRFKQYSSELELQRLSMNGGSPTRATRASTRASAAAGTGAEQGQPPAGGLAAAPGVAERAAKSTAAAEKRAAAAAARKAASAAAKAAAAAEASTDSDAAAAAGILTESAVQGDVSSQGAQVQQQADAPAVPVAPLATTSAPSAAVEPEAAAEGPAAAAAAAPSPPLEVATAAAPAPAVAAAAQGPVAAAAAAAADGLARLLRSLSITAAAPKNTEEAAATAADRAGEAAETTGHVVAAAHPAATPAAPDTAQVQQQQQPGDTNAPVAAAAVPAPQPAAALISPKVQTTLASALAAPALARAVKAADIAAAGGRAASPVPAAAAAAAMVDAPATPLPTAAAVAGAGSGPSTGSAVRRGRKDCSSPPVAAADAKTPQQQQQQQQQQPMGQSGSPSSAVRTGRKGGSPQPVAAADTRTPQQQQPGQPGSPSRGMAAATRSASKQQQQPSAVGSPAASPGRVSSPALAAAAAAQAPEPASQMASQHATSSSAVSTSSSQQLAATTVGPPVHGTAAVAASAFAAAAAAAPAASAPEVLVQAVPAPGSAGGAVGEGGSSVVSAADAAATVKPSSNLDDLLAAAAMALPDDD